MRKVKMYIAISLDGKISRADGSVDWLDKVPGMEESDHIQVYSEFIESIDVTLMGNKTFTSINGPEHGDIYPGKENYIFTRNPEIEDTPYFKYTTEDPITFTKKKLAESGKDIWCIGGGQINSMLYNAGMVDEIWLFMIPIVLGEGIPLFAEKAPEDYLDLIEARSLSGGLVLLRYDGR
jgi:dihydrofolate reductase